MKKNPLTISVTIIVIIIMAAAAGYLAMYFWEYANPLPPPGMCFISHKETGVECSCRPGCGDEKRSGNDLYNLALHTQLNYGDDSDALNKSIDTLCLALCTYPDFGAAHAGIAEALITQASSVNPTGKAKRKSLDKAFKWLERARELSPDDHRYRLPCTGIIQPWR